MAETGRESFTEQTPLERALQEKGAMLMLQVILVAIAVLVALSYIFASVAGEAGQAGQDEPAAKQDSGSISGHDATAA